MVEVPVGSDDLGETVLQRRGGVYGVPPAHVRRLDQVQHPGQDRAVEVVESEHVVAAAAELLRAFFRERILDSARALGYPGPDPLARGLRRGRAGAIGVVSDTPLSYAFDDPAASAVLAGVWATPEEVGLGVVRVPPRGERVSRPPGGAGGTQAFGGCSCQAGARRRPPLVLLVGEGLPALSAVSGVGSVLSRALGRVAVVRQRIPYRAGPHVQRSLGEPLVQRSGTGLEPGDVAKSGEDVVGSHGRGSVP